MSDNYNSLVNSSDLLVPVKAATVFAAHEGSLYLGGQIIPVVSAPNGLLQVPKVSGGSAVKLSGQLNFEDVAATAVTGAKTSITCDLYAARTVVRDLGAVDASEIGRQLGNKISASFDADVTAAMATLTAGSMAGVNLAVADIFAAVAAIRGAGETGQLFGVVSTAEYAAIMANIGSANYAGGDTFQGQAIRSGFLGTIAGVQLFVSSYLTAGAAVFGQDAMRIAMQKNVDVEMARRAEAVGNDVVASLHAAVGVVDATRGVYLS